MASRTTSHPGSPWDDNLIEVKPTDFAPPRDLPFRKDVRRRTAWIEFVLLRALQRSFSWLPAPVLNGVVGPFARFARLVDRRHARAARDFLGTAFPGADPAEIERRVLDAYEHLVRVVVETEHLDEVIGKPLGASYDVEVCAGLEELVASGQGFVLLTAHVGFWEGIGLPLHALGYHHGVAVGKPPNNHHLARWIEERRQSQGAFLLPREGAIAGVTAAVRSGGVAILLLDQRPRQKPIIVDFFGRPAACDRSAGVLVRRASAPLVVAACYLTETPRRYRLVFQRVVGPEELSGARPEEVMALVNQETEALVRRAPEQYFWLHNRFRDAPPANSG